MNSPHYRLRIGDYRVILDIREDALRVLVVKAGHRESIYERWLRIGGWLVLEDR